jgi:hypothetical protein
MLDFYIVMASDALNTTILGNAALAAALVATALPKSLGVSAAFASHL